MCRAEKKWKLSKRVTKERLKGKALVLKTFCLFSALWVRFLFRASSAQNDKLVPVVKTSVTTQLLWSKVMGTILQ